MNNHTRPGISLTPRFPVPVVRLIVANEKGEVLIVRRHGSAHASGFWCLPGGKVDYGETVEQAVAKELREETALTCTASRFLFYQDSLPPEADTMHCINLYFECDVAGDLVLNEESSDYAWITSASLSRYDMVFRNDDALLQYWKAEK